MKKKNEKNGGVQWRSRMTRAAGMLFAAVCIGIIGCSVVIRAEENVSAEAEIAIDETNFPDENFRNYVKEFDTDGNGSLSVSERETVTMMELDGLNIESVDGIKHFSYLKNLWCWHENIRELDLSGMENLTQITCEKNESLEELNVSGCSWLYDLKCDSNNLRKLNATGCKVLEELDCDDNKLEELNVTGCMELNRLSCNSNLLKKIDLTDCNNLIYFECNNNELSELNMANYNQLSTLECSHNKLQKLDVTNCKKLAFIECSYNKLPELDVTTCEYLMNLKCSYNELQELDITNCKELGYVSCGWNNLTELNPAEHDCDVYAAGNYIDEEKAVGEYMGIWEVFPMKKYTFMGEFNKTTNTIPYTDLGLNLYMFTSFVAGRVNKTSCCISGKKVAGAEGMTYSNEAGVFYIEPFEKEKTVSFTYLGHTVEMRLVNMNFQDVQTKDWFFDPVAYVNENNLMTGMNETTFAPSDTLARAQFAVILHRMNGKPAMQYTEKFPDVGEKLWYTDAVLWASQAKVVNGYTSNGCFGPADQITREQMAAMMYRYAVFKGYDTSVRKEIDTFEDAADVSAYALDAMQWAVGNEIITGKTMSRQLVLDPKGYANRAECAAIIMRLMMKYKE